jgi:hypothetical protein
MREITDLRRFMAESLDQLRRDLHRRIEDMSRAIRDQG